MTIEVTVVVGRKLRIRLQFSSEHSAGKRHSREDPDFLFFRARKEEFSRALAETVENNLDGLNVGELDRLERFFDLLHAHAVVADFAGLRELVERGEHVRPVVHLGRRAVQLHEIERIGLQVLQAAINERGQILAVVTGGRVRVEPPARHV